jgi:hypothetical protein
MCLSNFAHSGTTLRRPCDIPKRFLNISKQLNTFQHGRGIAVSRRASRCANVSYIVGDTTRVFFPPRLSSAWTSVAKGLKSNHLRTGASLPRPPPRDKNRLFRF